MDYREIIFKGLSEQRGKYFKEHLKRECKRAEADYYNADEFFNGCLVVIKDLKEALAEARNNRLTELNKRYLRFAGDSAKEIERQIQGIIQSKPGAEKITVDLKEFTEKKYWGELRSEQIERIEREIKEVFDEVTHAPESAPKPTPALSLKQIALLYYYQKKAIDSENANEIAESYGHKSGHKLKQLRSDWAIDTDRTGNPGSKRKLSHKIKDFEAVIPLLQGRNREKAEAELKKIRGYESL